jgi:hypothetical protein
LNFLNIQLSSLGAGEEQVSVGADFSTEVIKDDLEK